MTKQQIIERYAELQELYQNAYKSKNDVEFERIGEQLDRLEQEYAKLEK